MTIKLNKDIHEGTGFLPVCLKNTHSANGSSITPGGKDPFSFETVDTEVRIKKPVSF
jgi:hypothetical protein